MLHPALASVRTTLFARRFWAAMAATVFVLTDVSTSYASGSWDSPLPDRASSFAGMAAMFRLQIPLGAESRQAGPNLSLSAGSLWRGESAPSQGGSLQYQRHLEMRLAFDGSPVLRLNSLDLLNTQRLALGAVKNDDDTPHWVWWVLGGAAAATVIALIVAGGRNKSSGELAYW